MAFRAPGDDNSIWLQAYQAHGPSILAFLISRVGHRDRAEEFLQETFVRAMRRGAGESANPNLRAYLFTTAHHLVISDRRRERVRRVSAVARRDTEPRGGFLNHYSKRMWSMLVSPASTRLTICSRCWSLVSNP